MHRSARRRFANNFFQGAEILFRSYPLLFNYSYEKSVWEESGESIAQCWQEVGVSLRDAMNAHEEKE